MQWFVGYTGINQEPLARRGLKDLNLEVYLPMGSKMVRHARKEEVRVFPIFSRYLFIKFEPTPESLASIRSTDGIIDILTNNWIPMSVPDVIIDGIRELEGSGFFDVKPQFHVKPKKWSRGFSILKAILEPTRA
jgi:transcriptional antiterminator RfaH